MTSPHTSGSHTVAVVIPHIPPRKDELRRALASVDAQTLPPNEIVVHTDREGIGAAQSRNLALGSVTCDWTAFLDDDDEWLPRHLRLLVDRVIETNACLVYPVFRGLNTNLFRKLLEAPFSAYQSYILHGHANYIPICVLARTSCLRAVGGFRPPPWSTEKYQCEDWGAWVRMLDNGCGFANVDEVTWQWNRSTHTSGRPWREVYVDHEGNDA